MGLERGAVCRRVGMRAPQHEQRARPSTRGVAREPAKATLRGLTSDVSQTTPSELGEAPVLPSHVSQGASFQINILARSSMNMAVSTLGPAGAPLVQQLSPRHPQGPSGASFPPPQACACSFPCSEGGTARLTLHTTSGGGTDRPNTRAGS